MELKQILVEVVDDWVTSEAASKASQSQGRHLCKEMRGVKKKGEMIATKLKGVFMEDTDVRGEFLNYVNNN